MRGEPNPGLHRKMQLAFGSAMLTLLVVGAISYRGMVVSSESGRWVSHSHEVLQSLQDLVLAVDRIESNSRGFALTGKESYLEAYRAGVLRLAQDQAAIRSLTSDNLEHQRQIPELENLTAQKIERTEKDIRLHQARGPRERDPVQPQPACDGQFYLWATLFSASREPHGKDR
jgi:CHASE3 domain sensor protein